jgi:hypothetical protein
MSQTWSLVCHDTKEKVWIGQGNGQMSNFYSCEPNTMEALRKFLIDTIGKKLEFICDDSDWDCIDYNELSEQQCD